MSKKNWMAHFFCACLMLSITTSIEAMPAQVIIIRRAEKERVEGDISLKGKERAAALAPYFMEEHELLQYGPPVAIFAIATSADRPTQRTLQTVEPLAEKLKIVVNTSFHVDDYPKMIEMIRANTHYNGKMILICWDHRRIPNVARGFGVREVPEWPDSAFDRTWIVSFSDEGVPSLVNLPQRLLFGDSPE